MTSVDYYTKLDFELSKIPYCSSKCTYYAFCPVCDRSGLDVAPCVMLMLPEKKRRRFVNLYLMGRDGLQAEARELLYNLANSLNLKDNAEDMMKYIDAILKIDRNFKIDQRKVIETPIIEKEDIPSKVEVVMSKKAFKKDPDQKAVETVMKELDDNVESLYNSGLIDELKESMRVKKLELVAAEA
jgi:uncharacterized protein YwgA